MPISEGQSIVNKVVWIPCAVEAQNWQRDEVFLWLIIVGYLSQHVIVLVLVGGKKSIMIISAKGAAYGYRSIEAIKTYCNRLHDAIPAEIGLKILNLQ